MSIRVYKLKNGKKKYMARKLLNGRGSRHICRTFKRKSDAEAFLNKLGSQLDDPSKCGSTFEDTSFQKEAEFWFDYQKKQVSPSSKKRIKLSLNMFFKLVGNLKPNELHPGRIVLLQKELLARGLSGKTVNKNIGVIHAVLNFSVKMKRIPFNPCAGYPKLKEIDKPMKFWSKQEATSFLEFASHKYPIESDKRWIYISYFLAINTGLRAGEIWGLFPGDIDYNRNIIRLDRQYDRVECQLRPLKHGKNRRVPCNISLQNEIKCWVQKKDIPSNHLLFTNQEGNPIDHDNFAVRQFKKDVLESHLRPIRFHDLRHTAGTLMVSSGIDIVTVKEVLGHSNIKTTLGYVHVLAENIQKVANSFTIEPREIAPVINLPRTIGEK